MKKNKGQEMIENMSFELDDFDVKMIRDLDSKYIIDKSPDTPCNERYRILQTIMRVDRWV